MTKSNLALAPLLRRYFLERLIEQRGASPATVAAYRDAFRILLQFAEKKLRRPAASLLFEDLTPSIILAFLAHLERERGNCARTRNARLAVIRSFAKYAGSEEPVALDHARRLLAIPSKRCARPVLTHLSRQEIATILRAPESETWSGDRDRVLLATLYNTGARVSEAIGLNIEHIFLDRTPRVELHGKGRKTRTIPLWKSTAKELARWIRQRAAEPNAPLFTNRVGERITRSGVARRLAIAVASAMKTCPSLRNRRVSPHTIRHTTAMHLLEAGNDISIIALWLGHESPNTTHAYLEADVALKARVLSRLDAPHARRGRFRASDDLLAFLERL
jgi:integrase/recombinase XerD